MTRFFLVLFLLIQVISLSAQNKPLTKYGYGMEEEVDRVLRKGPKWIPAEQFGTKVKAYRRQPVTFVVSERR